MANDLNTKVNELTSKALEDLKGKVNKETVNEKLTKVKQEAALKAEDVQEEAKEKATSTVKKASEKVQNQISNIDIVQEIKNQFTGSDLAFLVNDLVEDSIDEIVADEIDKARQNFNLSSSGQMLATAESYYKSVLNSQVIMTEMRDDYTDHLSSSINSMINDRLYSLQDKLGGEWARKLLGTSKIASTISSAVNREVANVVNAIISDKVIAGVSQDIVDTVTRIQNSARDQIETALADEIEYATELKKTVEDKIQVFQEQKQIYEEKLAAQVEKLQEAINEAIRQVEQVIISEISKVIKIDASSLNLGF
jgi:hypothetical protein